MLIFSVYTMCVRLNTETAPKLSIVMKLTSVLKCLCTQNVFKTLFNIGYFDYR